MGELSDLAGDVNMGSGACEDEGVDKGNVGSDGDVVIDIAVDDGLETNVILTLLVLGRSPGID